MPDLDAPSQIRTIILTKGGTGEPIILSVPVPDSIDKAHRRITKEIRKYRVDNTPPGKEPGDCDTVTVQRNSAGIVLLMMAQDAPPSDTGIVASLVEEAITGNTPKMNLGSGPSS